MGALQISLLSAFWVAFRGSNRRFYPSMRLRVSLVGLLSPVVMACIWMLFQSLEYGTPTRASPRLEVLFVTCVIAGEAVVRFASHPAGLSH